VVSPVRDPNRLEPAGEWLYKDWFVIHSIHLAVRLWQGVFGWQAHAAHQRP